jgi:hypothetical protein
MSEIKEYIKKPVKIKALQWTGKNADEIHKFCLDCYANSRLGILMVNTLEGPMRASEGDFIIKGIKGEFYPCKPDIFKVTYEEVNNKNQ